jgi:ectoine hydroxylase-related dioxygenase (phytanoyl-CoA dioxygenase family)
VPGSHLWDDAKRAQEHEITTAELSRGEALLFLTSTLHAGGANTTPDPRSMYAIFYCRSWVRPEVPTCPLHMMPARARCDIDTDQMPQMNDFTCYTQEEVDSWSIEAQKLVGYVTDKMLGICDDGHPLDALRRSGTHRWQDWLV